MIVACYQRTMAGARQRAAQRGIKLGETIPAPKPLPKHVEAAEPAQRVEPVVRLMTPRDHFYRIMDLVARMHGSSFDAIMGKTRKPKHAHARQAAVCAVREAYPDISVPHLGRAFGGLDHSTLYNTFRKRGYQEKR